jgi:hypothetical protein
VKVYLWLGAAIRTMRRVHLLLLERRCCLSRPYRNVLWSHIKTSLQDMHRHFLWSFQDAVKRGVEA